MADDIKKNLELFSMEEIEEIQDFVHNKITSYYDACKKYRDEWNKWNRAYNCVYHEEDHSIPTGAKLFDPETADSIDTVSKRINVAIFSNDKISELTFNEYKDTELLNTSQAMWDKKLDEMNYRLTLESILKSGIINGTYIAKVIPQTREHLEFITDENGDRRSAVVVDTTPMLKYVNIYDFYADPSVERLEDSEVIAEKLLMDNVELENGEFIKKNIEEYNTEKKDDSTAGDSEIGIHKQNFYDDNGIDIQSLIVSNKRYVYHTFFKWRDADGIEGIYFAIIDAVNYKILSIEPNYMDNNIIPYKTCHYLTRPDCLFGIGAAEQAHTLQIMLNDLYNGFLDSVQTLNEMAYFGPQVGDTLANEVMTVDKFKIIPVMNPDKIVPIIPHGLPDVLAVTDKLREQIQKKTKATMLMQGLPMEGTRTATEMVGIREEQNLSIKDIIDNTVQNFLEPLLNLYRQCMAQFYEADDIVLKVPINDATNSYKTLTISFDELRGLFAEADIKITSVAEQNQKSMELNELKGLMQIGFERPDVINAVAVMKKIYFDILGMKDFDKFLTNSVMTGTPVDPQQENILLKNGTPLNTHENDNHMEHLQIHKPEFDQLMAAIQQDIQRIGQNPVMQKVAQKTIFNFENHMKEHIMNVENEQQGQMNEQPTAV